MNRHQPTQIVVPPNAFLVFALCTGLAFAGDGMEPSSGPAPQVDATEGLPVMPLFAPDTDAPTPGPSHPPIDSIPAMPMPDASSEQRSSAEPGNGVMYDAASGEITEFPATVTDDVIDVVTGGGYDGADGGVGMSDLESPAGMSGPMTEILNTEDTPWRMNVKVVMRFGTSYSVCSGTMRDARAVLTAGHCIFDFGGAGWADEVWVYPGWDGVGGQWNPPPSIVNPYGYARSTRMGSWTGWTENGDLNYDVGIIALDRAVGALTGWFGYAYGGDCSWHISQNYDSASYPAENCGGGLHTRLDMYYWFGQFDSCPSWNRLQIDTVGGCLGAIWGGQSGSGAYYRDGGSRFVHGITSTSNRSTFARYARQWDDWVAYNNDTFIPDFARGAIFDLQPLDVNVSPSTLQAGDTTTVLNHLAVNPTNGSANDRWNYGVYLSSNDNISTSDTLLSSQSYDRNFGTMDSVRVNMVQVTIPVDTPPGDYWVGVVYDCATDDDCNDNDTDGWDPAQITVTAAPEYTLTIQKSGTGGGTVTSDPQGINCGSDCSEGFLVDTAVTLRASPNAGSTFADWSGPADCSDGRVTMSADLTCTATFDLAQVDPSADIKANGSDGPIDVSVKTPVTVTIDLDAGSSSAESDWWILARTCGGWYSFGLGGTWQPGQVVTHQGPLFDLKGYEVLNRTLPACQSYQFYFGVDTVPNRQIDIGSMYYDRVEVTVQ